MVKSDLEIMNAFEHFKVVLSAPPPFCNEWRMVRKWKRRTRQGRPSRVVGRATRVGCGMYYRYTKRRLMFVTTILTARWPGSACARVSLLHATATAQPLYELAFYGICPFNAPAPSWSGRRGARVCRRALPWRRS